MRVRRKKTIQAAPSAEESLREAEQTRREIKGSIFALLALFELVALGSHVPVDRWLLFSGDWSNIQNLAGLVGAVCGELFLGTLGLPGYVVVIITSIAAVVSFRGLSLRDYRGIILGLSIASILAAMGFYIAFNESVSPTNLLTGGWVGLYGGGWLEQFFHRTGAGVLLIGGLLLTAITTTKLSLERALRPFFGDQDLEEDDFEEDLEEDEVRTLKKKPSKRKKTQKKAQKKSSKKKAETSEEDEDEELAEKKSTSKKKRAKRKVEEDEDDDDELPQEMLDALEEEDDEEEEETIAEEAGGFQEMIYVAKKFALPSTRLLENHSTGAKKPSRGDLRKKAKKLCDHLLSFGITGEVTNISVGPVLITYEFKPSAGIKLKAIAGVQDDLGIVMGTPDLRIVAPIPGKTVVGIEVPRDKTEFIPLKELVSHKSFNDKKLKLPIALGKSTDGKPMLGDLTAMPHLLVAGATGSGKSVFVNCLITSLIYRLSPQQLRMILIDPKMLELNIFDGIPHLIGNVITNNNHAYHALQWAVMEMERRYQLMSEHGSKNIDSYNSKIRKAEAKLPYIVIVVDELADLMMTMGADVEVAITRLAQKARAAGIHLVIATQRPSTDVITGIIKANMPSRLSFKVPSGVDSRTVLDTGGAEALTGRGDSLMVRPARPLERIHACFTPEEELKRVMKKVRGGKMQTDYYIDFSVPPSEED